MNIQLDEWKIIFQKNPLAICIVDKKNWHVLECNFAFQHFVGKNSDIHLSEMIYKRDLQNLQKRLSIVNDDQFLQDNIRMLTRASTEGDHSGGLLRDVQISLQKVTIVGKSALICVLQDIGLWTENKNTWKNKWKEENSKNTQLMQYIGNVEHNYHIIDFILYTIQKLSCISSKKELLQQVVDLFSQNEFFSEISIYLQQEEHLKLICSNVSKKQQSFHMAKKHRFIPLALGNSTIFSPETGELILPISGEKQNLGIIQFIFQIEERIFLNSYIQDIKSYQNIFHLFCHFLGTKLEFLQLQEQYNYNLTHHIPSNYPNKILLQEQLQYYDEFSYMVVFHLDHENSMVEYDTYAKILQQLVSLSEKDNFFQIYYTDYAYIWTKTEKKLQNWLKKLKKLWQQQTKSMPLTICCLPIQKTIFQNLTICLTYSLEHGGDKIIFWDKEAQTVYEFQENKGCVLS